MEEKSAKDTKMIAQEGRQRIFEDIESSGITIEHGLTEFNFEEAGTKRTMIERARQRIVVADHTKFGKVMLIITKAQ